MTTFITRYETSGPGVRLAVKDLIDMAGELTTAGCRAVADRAVPAARDAACLAGARAAGARIVGRTNLHELALGVTGVNQWYGTPVNPLDPTRVPGGSSSGSAVAVATGEADVAYGSDTGGSVRIPAACCGTTGLKTTWGRIPLDGVWPLAPSFDTVGPMARDVAGLVHGDGAARTRLRASADGRRPISPWAGCPSRRTRPSPPRSTGPWSWRGGTAGSCRARVGRRHLQAGLLLVVEAWHSDAALVRGGPRGDQRRRAGPAGARISLRRGHGRARVGRPSARGRRRSSSVFTEVDFLVTPTLTIFPPRLEDGDDLLVSRLHPSGEPGGSAGTLAAGADGRAVARQPAADRAGAQRGAAAGGRARVAREPP